jgi:hypothetical protein
VLNFGKKTIDLGISDGEDKRKSGMRLTGSMMARLDDVVHRCPGDRRAMMDSRCSLIIIYYTG